MPDIPDLTLEMVAAYGRPLLGGASALSAAAPGRGVQLSLSWCASGFLDLCWTGG